MTAKLKTAVAAAILVCGVVPAAAHVSLEKSEAAPGAYKAVFRVPHGCEKTATHTVIITIPEGVIGVKPMPKPGWTLAMTNGAYAQTYDHHHGAKVSEGVKSVTWSGGKLPDEHFDEFSLSVFLTRGLAAGSTLYFPVTQLCETGSLAWSQIPADGQDSHALKAPAPSLRILAAAEPATAEPVSYTIGSLKIDEPWARATPGGATVAAGYLKLTNTGPAADKFVGASSPVSGRTELHDMTMDNGVAKMRHLTDGIEIPAGSAVALAPGGMHVMFLDLKAHIEAGQSVPVELEFEKAGKVIVVFKARPIGAKASGDHKDRDHGQHDHKHH